VNVNILWLGRHSIAWPTVTWHNYGSQSGRPSRGIGRGYIRHCSTL